MADRLPINISGIPTNGSAEQAATTALPPSIETAIGATNEPILPPPELPPEALSDAPDIPAFDTGAHSETIGHAISSGCFRLVNGDVIDLYGRVDQAAAGFAELAKDVLLG